MKILLSSKIFTVCLFLLNVNLLFAQEWEMAKEKDGVTVYTRKNDDSPIKEFKASTTVNVKIEKLKYILSDFGSYVHCYDHWKKAQLVSKEPDGIVNYHIEYFMPFPFKNRDAVLSLQIKEEKELVKINITRKAGVMDEKEGIVRMPVSEGSWRLTKISQDKTLVEHQFKGDPAGNIPSGVVNMFLVAGPINTLSSLKRFATGTVK